MGNFTYEIRDGIAWVTFDSGGMNTLSLAAIGEHREAARRAGGGTRQVTARRRDREGQPFRPRRRRQHRRADERGPRRARSADRRRPRRAVRHRGQPVPLARGRRRLRTRRHLRVRARVPRHHRDRDARLSAFPRSV